MRKGLRKAIAIGLVSLGALGVGAKVSGVLSKPAPRPAYEYAIGKNLGKDIAQEAEKRFGYELDENSRKFIDVISSYPKNLQEVCLNSDILDNGNISDAELESVREAKLTGQVKNPKEIYAVIANGNGSDNPDLYSGKNARHSLDNISSFYNFLKSNGVSDKNIGLFVYNPTDTGLDDLVIDGKSDIETFSQAIRDSHTDSNDTLYVIYSNPGPESDKSLESHSLNRVFLSFDGNPNLGPFASIDKKTRLYSFNFADLLKKQYQKAIVIFNTWNSGNFLGNLETSLSGDNPKNVLAISSPNGINVYNETFMKNLIAKQIENPKMSIKELTDSMKGAEIYYYNENGVKRSPEESSWYQKPILSQ